MTTRGITPPVAIVGIAALAFWASAGGALAASPAAPVAPKGSVVEKHGQLRVKGNRIVDQNGKKLERSRDHHGRDPMIDFTASADGEYFVGVHDFIYNGGADYPYTLTISSKPEIDFVIH